MKWSPLDRYIKDRYWVVFVRNINGTPTQISEKRINVDTESVTFNDKTYIIDVKKSSLRKKNNVIIYVDLSRGQQCLDGELQGDGEYWKTIKAVVKEKVILQSIKSETTSLGIEGYLPFILIGALAFFGGLMLGLTGIIDIGTAATAPLPDPDIVVGMMR